MKREVEFRASTISEREEFYEKEFSIKKVKAWFKQNKLPLPQLCALDAGTDSGIILDKKNKGNMLYFHFKDLRKKIKQYIPEDVYYDRNTYANPEKVLRTLNFDNPVCQEIVFDLDVENMPGGKVNNTNLKKLYKMAKRMKKVLESDFKNVNIVYSGRGFHVHVTDKNAKFLTVKQREELNRKFSAYPLDSWVSRGHIRLIRMPYSLNSLVSRIVTPINSKEKFIPEKTYPKFLFE